MSIKVMSKVWEYSRQNGTRLLGVIALADYANDEGICFPLISTLTQRMRMTTERGTQKVLEKLQQDGEIFREQTAGRGHSNRFLVVVGIHPDQAVEQLVKEFGFTPKAASKFVEKVSKYSPIKKVNKWTRKGERMDTRGVNVRSEKVNKRTEKVKKRSPRTTKQPSVQPSEVNHQQPPENVVLVNQSLVEKLHFHLGIDKSNATKLATEKYMTPTYVDAWMEYKSNGGESARGGYYYSQMRDRLVPPNWSSTKQSRWGREQAGIFE